MCKIFDSIMRVFRSQERSVNNSQEIVFVESLKLWGLQKYIDTLMNFCRRAYSEGIYLLLLKLKRDTRDSPKYSPGHIKMSDHYNDNI